MKRIYLAIMLLALLFLSSCGGDDAVTMPASLCQATCTDDATGDTYGIAFRAIAWNNVDDSDDIGDDMDFGCYLYVDAYRGEMVNGEFVDGSYLGSRTLSGLQDYGIDEESGEVHKLTFFDTTMSDFTDTLLPNDIVYKLLFESNMQLSQDGTEMVATYTHSINPCIMDADLTLHAECDRTKDSVALTCSGTEDGEVGTLTLLDEHGDCVNCNNIHCPNGGEGETCTEDINSNDVETYHSELQPVIDAIS